MNVYDIPAAIEIASPPCFKSKYIYGAAPDVAARYEDRKHANAWSWWPERLEQKPVLPHFTIAQPDFEFNTTTNEWLRFHVSKVYGGVSGHVFYNVNNGNATFESFTKKNMPSHEADQWSGEFDGNKDNYLKLAREFARIAWEYGQIPQGSRLRGYLGLGR
jgi:hypothetical protein